MTKTQEDFIQKYKEKQEYGLIGVSFFLADNLTALDVDAFIAEDNAIDEAIKDGEYVPFPSCF